MSSSTVAAALINASPTTKVVHSMMSRNIQLTYILTSDVCYSGGASRHHLSTTLYSMSPPTDMAPPTVHVVQHGATYRSCRTAWRHLPFMSYNMVPPTVHVVQHGSGVARIFRLQGHEGARTFSSESTVECDRNFFRVASTFMWTNLVNVASAEDFPNRRLCARQKTWGRGRRMTGIKA